MSDTTRPDFTAVVRDTPGGPVIECAGDLDLDGVPVLHQALRRALATRPLPPTLVIGLEGVTFCDSSGLNGLLKGRIEAERQGVTIHLGRPAPTVARVLQITGADQVFPVDLGDHTSPRTRS
ncbi:STAS domain-containing protein [Kitasatospora sp. NBC_00240]|uniref:STAS domain-containing protein n=1 Tax=Kitasatospora sp. NBC_00240 TaxID=2903567 RepID=UPI0022536651|nr:STAS domain-containing protein [Kitasatospora sp. NBC_00240]MCX5215299.1 STAS domain-containing protein [Kitasatospora sp. NBC_00240]